MLVYPCILDAVTCAIVTFICTLRATESRRLELYRLFPAAADAFSLVPSSSNDPYSAEWSCSLLQLRPWEIALHLGWMQDRWLCCNQETIVSGFTVPVRQDDAWILIPVAFAACNMLINNPVVLPDSPCRGKALSSSIGNRCTDHNMTHIDTDFQNAYKASCSGEQWVNDSQWVINKGAWTYVGI